MTEGIITGVDITGENFGGTYAEVNRGKLQAAAEGMTEALTGLSDEDVEGIQKVDTVSGATYSSNGIKEAVKDALHLETAEETPEVPEEIPEAGTYRITVAVRSDVVDHSLVQGDTAQAVLEVDEAGNMQLSYRMISGTDQEPLYILDFNGYYRENDRSGTLTMEGVSYNTREAGEHTVVTDVSFPLTGGMSRYYYKNLYLYVPAMSNLNGEISGIVFEKRTF